MRGRVEQLESSYSEILSLLKQKPQSEASPAVAFAPSTSTPSQAGTSRVSRVTALTSPLLFNSDGSTGYFQDVPLEECEGLINDYRRISTAHFPYVIIPDGYPIATLIDERPLLAQAFLIATIWRSPERQRVLKENFLKDFTERYFIKSERSLDLLQALIVYFAW